MKYLFLIFLLVSLTSFGKTIRALSPSLELDSVVKRADESQKQLNFTQVINTNQMVVDSSVIDEDFIWIETYYGTKSFPFHAETSFWLDTLLNEKVRIFLSELEDEPEYRLTSINLHSDSIYYFHLWRGTIDDVQELKILMPDFSLEELTDLGDSLPDLRVEGYAYDSSQLSYFEYWLVNEKKDTIAHNAQLGVQNFFGTIYKDYGLKNLNPGKFELLIATCSEAEKVNMGYITIEPAKKYRLKIYFNSFVIDHIPLVDGFGYDKPVIYLYSSDTIEFYVDLDIDESITPTFFYPTPKSIIEDEGIVSWHGKVIDNKIEINGKKYPYIFWEGEGSTIPIMDKGFCISGDSTVSFLEEKLDKLGLNATEKTDFITYWAPKMIKNEYNIIHFKHTNEYYDIAEAFVNPTPDAILQFYMYFKPSTEFVELPAQEFPIFGRKGFTYVEWGGSELPQ